MDSAAILGVGYRPKYYKIINPVTSLETLDMPGLDELVKSERNRELPFGFLANEYYLSLIEKDDPDDPIRKMVVPSTQELMTYDDRLDISNEKGNTVAPGLQHKYDPTLLAIISDVCAGLCRQCFRKRLWMDGYQHETEALFPNEEAVKYTIDALEGKVDGGGYQKIPNTILLTGGDAFMLDNESIAYILNVLSQPEFNGLSTVRFGTRVFPYMPRRVDEELSDTIISFHEKTGKNVKIATHFNHPRELTDEAVDATKLFSDNGIEVYNQTVLMKGVNNDKDTMYELQQGLADEGISPYYMLQCRPVAGAKHFQTSYEEGLAIKDDMDKKLTGVHKPRYIFSTPFGKVEILGIMDGHLHLKFHSANPSSLTGKMFTYDMRDPNWVYRDYIKDYFSLDFNPA